MNRIRLSLLSTVLLLLHTHLLLAQLPSPHWARQIYGSKGSGTGLYDIASDKQGNVYALYNVYGYVHADNQITPDSTASTVITSWDCDGNLRWMKSFGATGNPSAYNTGLSLSADTSDGIYISGYATSYQVSGSPYWDVDTTISIAAGDRLVYLIKYNSQGQFQWLRTPAHNTQSDFYPRLSVTPPGEVFWFALLDNGVYDGGAFTIIARKYYAIHYDASGNYQATIPFDMTPPTSTNFGAIWNFDPATNRFYGSLNYSMTYGNLTVGNISITPPADSNLGRVVLGAFNQQGQNLWVRQGSIDKYCTIQDVAFGKDGSLYLRGNSEPGAVFCDDTATNILGQDASDYLMALDTNADLLWSNHSKLNQFSGVPNGFGISHANNTVVATGVYAGTLSWDNHSLTNTGQTLKGYMLRTDAATGTVQQLESIDASTACVPIATTLDRNDNIYITGVFQGNMAFANDSLSIPPPSWNTHNFLLKYKNAPCGCDLLQPAFNFSNTGASTYQYTYTGGTPYSSISWNFGDGTTANVPNPVHTYTSSGTYPVCVTVSNACGSNTTCQYLTLYPTHVKDAGGIFSAVTIYPNPAKEEITISGLPPGTTVEVWDVLGRRLKKMKSDKTSWRISIEDLNPGIHLLRFKDLQGRRGGSVFLKK